MKFNLISKILISYCFVIPTIFIFYAGVTVGLSLLGVGFVTFVLINLDKFESFKAAGVEAKLQKTIDDAMASKKELEEVEKKIKKIIEDEKFQSIMRSRFFS